MKQSVVLGSLFGDEGKATMVDRLSRNTDRSILVVRFSGGNQVSHTVARADKKHVFSNFGSGTLNNVPTYWSKFCTISPTTILNELDILKQKGYAPILYVDRNCPVTTPFEVYANKLDAITRSHGTCGAGYGNTIKREETFYSLVFSDLFYPSILRAKLNSIIAYYENKAVLVEADIIDNFINDCLILTETDEIKLCDENVMENKDHVIFEGSQGLLLDQHYGFFPNVTRSNTGTTNIKSWLNKDADIYLMTRAYQTRHGNGFMTNENKRHNIFQDLTEANKTNEYQGVFRKSLLDLDLLNYAFDKDEFVRNSKNKRLIVTCMDHSKNDYRFTDKDEIIACCHSSEFLSEIAKRTRVVIGGFNTSPDSSTMCII